MVAGIPRPRAPPALTLMVAGAVVLGYLRGSRPTAMTPPVIQAPRRVLGCLFTRPAGSARPLAVVGWWEGRRVAYNLIVGAVGVVSSGVMLTVAFTCESRGGAPIGLPDPPLFAVFAVLLYGILANVCYTGGWITELLVARFWGVDTSRFGPIAFSLGTAFSVLVTLVPAGVVIVIAAVTSCGGP